jgi:tetratricopeptide (TPR) repeat protein
MKSVLLATLALFNSLDPHSLSQTLAYYEIYPERPEALERAMDLLHVKTQEEVAIATAALNRASEQLTEKEVAYIEQLAASLPNRRLKGYSAKSEREIFASPSEEIDLGMALLLSQLDGREDAHLQARRYSALLDLMALQILAKLPKEATPLEKIKETNRFIFDQMHFRFPPHSLYSEHIDLYTFLPSVMDNHLGVCLGVTALYLAIAQRIDLPLEIITPPGHIYIRYREGERITNIETTARGVNYPCEKYLSVNTRKLEERTIKEVIGMTHVNQAGTYLHSGKYDQAVASYEKALPFMSDDLLVKELLGYSYLFVGKKEAGERLLHQVVGRIPEEAIVAHGIADDYLAGKVDLAGIKAIFTEVDERRDSIFEKQKELIDILEKYPNFREGIQQLAVTWIQLNRAKEAIAVLKRYDALDPGNPVASYYLSVLHGERHDYKACWYYLKQAETITAARDFSPKALRELRRQLSALCPE